MAVHECKGWSTPRAAAEVGVHVRTFVRSWQARLIARGAAWHAGSGTKRVCLRFDPEAVLRFKDERRIRLPGRVRG